MIEIELSDGARLACADVGAGDDALVLIHGFGGSHQHFAPQLEALSAERRVVALDRRGNGASAEAAAAASVAATADDVIAVCDELGVGGAVVVVHSMDAIGYELAARHGERVRGLVVLDGPTLAPEPYATALREFGAALGTPAYAQAIRAFADQLVFAPRTPEADRDAIVNDVLATPRAVLEGDFRAFLAYDVAPAIARVRQPLLHVAGSFPADLDRVRALAPQLEVAEVRGVGHLVQLAAAERVNGLIAEFCARLATPV
jgi:pyruvate dehydrogenase E2 component (dihydrolipoamide acetyltransferase)